MVSDIVTMEIVAEVGTAHSGDLEKARKFIDEAARAGADTVKFQAIIADEILHPNVGSVSLHGQNRDLYQEFRDLERPADFYLQLKGLAEAAGLRFLCSVFGEQSARMMFDLGVDRVKIASPELNHFPLLQTVTEAQISVILSTGVSKLADLEAALEILDRQKVSVLHCVTSYPAPPEDYRLHLLPHLSAVFGVPFGVSDHSLDPLMVPLSAMVAGSMMLEKHLTLDKSGGGLDDPIALDPIQFRDMVRAIRQIERVPAEDRKRAIIEMIGKDNLLNTLGRGPRVLAPSERSNYGRTNRSICARRNLPAGDELTLENVGIFRVEKSLRPGLSPYLLPVLLGKRLVRDVAAGEGIVWDDLLSGTPQNHQPPG